MAFNFSSNLERHMYENRIDLLGFKVEQAMNIANFISIDYHNRRFRCGFVLRNDCLTRFFCFCAYWYLYKLLELLAHNTPFSVVLAEQRGILAQWNGSVEGSEQVFREHLDHMAMHKQELKNELTNIDDELMEVRSNLKEALKARAKLASLEFNILSPTIIREKDTI
ncbi:hypothetical protein MtrunA17_Chr1g0169611 [Medicago truncatula]|uniref:Uncharacterized protein n=1 Tax=Medicago truncatula TaxID=3880 RepID=A0A396JRA3_MEDTR|nr:hypothetical protein MtrunA17_Chr1g0169611 [Medicago truncatula]